MQLRPTGALSFCFLHYTASQAHPERACADDGQRTLGSQTRRECQSHSGSVLRYGLAFDGISGAAAAPALLECGL